MHPIEILLYRFQQTVAQGKYKIPEATLATFSESTAAHLKRQFEREPKDFTLRMSNLGKPLCQLECEQAGIKGISWDNNSLTRNTFGDICEDVLMFMLHASGVPIVSEQEPVELMISGQKIKGTLDLVIDFGKPNDTWENGVDRSLEYIPDPRVWDIKSASDWTFKNKFTLPFDRFIEEDTFGYVDQLFLYAESKGYPVGGNIVQNKSSGEILAYEFPTEQRLYREAAIAGVEAKVTLLSESSGKIILSDSIFKGVQYTRYTTAVSLAAEPVPTTKFKPAMEYFRSKPTGNLILNPKCSFCEYKFHCYPNVQLKPKAKSTAKVPQLQYYVEYHDE